MSDSTPHASAPLLPADWIALGPLLDQVLDAAPEDRAAVLDLASGGDPARRAALQQLVDECETPLPLIDQPIAIRFPLLLDDDEPTLPAVLNERYRMGRRIGRGGMARVFLARDLRHDRDVAIKVVRAELAASMGRDRFLREIAIAARLRHPNILPLYDSGDADGTLFFVMPFESGPNLRQRLTTEGALPVAEVRSILRDVARALHHAHAQGVVHRDIKPDNVLMSGGAAVVADFGIAKAFSVAHTRASGATITQGGAGIGTPTYMAPEQAVGDPTTDHRADIYAFGCMAYELLVGRPPFVAATAHQLIAAHMGSPPPALRDARRDIPAALAQLVERCLAKDPVQRPQGAAELLDALELGVAPPGGETLPAVAARTGFLVTLAAVVAVGALTWFLRRDAPPGPPITVAVLPFGNSAADSSVAFVGEALADEVAASLTRIPGIQVKSRAGARLYRGQLGVDVAEAGTRLDADYVMTGVVREDGGRWILSADLARAADGTSLWGDAFSVEPDQQAGAVDRIAGSVLAALRQRFPGAIGTPSDGVPAGLTTNNEAYRLYLRGQERLSRRGLSVKMSADLFRDAIGEDTLFARAYSGLSMALVLFPYFQGVSPDSVKGEVVRAAQRALALAPGLAQPHIALGLVHQFAMRWDSAAVEFETAITRDPRDIEARVQMARHLIFRGRHGDALRQLRVARELDPASALVLSWTAYAYFLSGSRDSALAESRRSLENDSTNLTSLSLGLLILSGSGQQEDMRRLLTIAPRFYSPMVGYVRATIGDTGSARELLRALDAERPPRWQVETFRAFAHLGLADTTQALDALERATATREIWHTLYSVKDPAFRSVIGTPRFASILRRIGLDSASEAARLRP